MTGNNRASIFDSQDDELDVSGFAPKTGPAPDAPTKEKVREVAEAANFRSREPARSEAETPVLASQAQNTPVAASPVQAPAARQRRTYRTGRNVQFNVKVSQETIDGFYRVADAQGWVLGEVLEQALAALDRDLQAKA